MSNNHKIDYVEFASPDLEKSKAFYQATFAWEFTDYGPDYTAFKDGRLDGGFTSQTESVAGSTLIVLYADSLDETIKAVEANGGKIVKPIFSFPGGRRFHFADPNGLEMAVWSDK